MKIKYTPHCLIDNINFPLKSITISLILIGFISSAFAQNQTLHKNIDFPYTLAPYREASLMIAGTGLLYAGAFTQRALEPLDYQSIQSLNPDKLLFFDKWATTQWNPRLNTVREILEPAAIMTSLGLIGAYGLHNKIFKQTWTPLLTLTMMYFEAFYITEGMVLLSKSLVKRPRPYTHNAAVPMEDKLRSSNNESFLSGNAGILFFNATFASQVLSDIFPDQGWLPFFWAGSHGLALLSGYWSVKSGMHFPTDILGGALWGSGIALLVTHLHKNKSQRVMITATLSGAKLLIRL